MGKFFIFIFFSLFKIGMLFVFFLFSYCECLGDRV